MLVLFDVDGTLTSTTDCDLRCFKQAMEAVFGISLPSDDWNTYRHVTDTGIISEIVETTLHRQVALQEFHDFESAFESILRHEHRSNPSAFGEIAGAHSMLEHLNALGIPFALASGGMRKSAHFKLACAGIDGAAHPGAFANDAHSREGIALCAMERSGSKSDDVVYVGDGVWDVRTSRKLGMRFVGVTCESSQDRLMHEGATVCIEDYSDLQLVLDAIRSAAVPGNGRHALESA